jgi:murein DD-endopeptidase MepM/ murein hydrolase activator NlpD
MIQTKEQEKLDYLLALTFKLEQEGWLNNEEERKEIFKKLLNYAQIIGFPIAPDDPEFLPKLRLKILEEYQKAPELPPASLPPTELKEIYEKAQQEKELELQKKIASQKTYQDYQQYVDFWKKRLLKNQPELPPKLTEAIAEKIADKTISNLPPVAQARLLTDDDLQQVKKEELKTLENELKNLKIEIRPPILQEAEKIVATEAQKIEKEKKEVISQAEQIVENEWQKLIKKISIEPKIIQSVKETSQIVQPTEIKNIPPLPPEILNQLNQPPEEVSFLPLYTFLHPKVATAFMEKAVYTLPAKFLSLTADDASPEWQAIMQNGLFAEDLQASLKALKSMGVPENHPLLKKLSDKAASLQEQQKFTLQTKDGQIIYKDTLAARIFKHYYHFDKITNRQKIYDEDLKKNLPRLSPEAIWSQGGYAGFLRNSLNRFKFIINTYEKFSKFVTKGKYTSFLTPVKQFFYKKFAQPAIQWLAKTAAGKAVKAGAKKAATWLAAKAGVKLGIWAAGAATAAPSAGVSLLIAAAVEIGTRLLGKIWEKIKTIIRDPEKAFMSIGLGLIFLFFIPGPLRFIGIIPIVFGGLGLITFIAAPATLTTIGGGIGAFFTALTTMSFAAPIALFIIILLGVLAGLTIFIVMVVSGAFILPNKVAEVTPTTISPYESEYFTITKTASPNKLENSDLNKHPQIEYTVKIVAKNNYKLTINSITEEVNLNYDQKSGKQLSVTPYSFKEDLDKSEHIKVSSWEKTYKSDPLTNDFENTAIINTVKAEITVEGEIGVFPAVASAIVTIGTPPGDCPPFPWPTTGKISQGPEGGTSHYKNDEEAIDIANKIGTPVYATHNGIAIAKEQPTGAGFYVEISGNCNGLNYWTEYFHLLERDRVSGPVTRGQLIGYMDNSGDSTGPHLHYEFRPKRPKAPFKMEPPNIPQALPKRSCDSIYECGITIE